MEPSRIGFYVKRKGEQNSGMIRLAEYGFAIILVVLAVYLVFPFFRDPK